MWRLLRRTVLLTFSMKNARLLGLGFSRRSIACLLRHICIALSFNANLSSFSVECPQINDGECFSVLFALVSTGFDVSGNDDSLEDATSASRLREDVAMRFYGSRARTTCGR